MSKENKKRYFPCPVCKGQGDFGDGDFVDVGIGVPMQVSAHNECGYCEGEAMIEIGGAIHIRNKAIKAGMKYLEKESEEGKEYSWEEIEAIGRDILSEANEEEYRVA